MNIFLVELVDMLYEKWFSVWSRCKLVNIGGTVGPTGEGSHFPHKFAAKTHFSYLSIGTVISLIGIHSTDQLQVS